MRKGIVNESIGMFQNVSEVFQTSKGRRDQAPRKTICLFPPPLQGWWTGTGRGWRRKCL